MSNQNKLPYPVRPLYPAVPATDVTPSYQPPTPSASMNPYPQNSPVPYPPPSSSVYPTNPITYPPIDPSQASVYPPNNPGAAAAPLSFNPYPPQNPQFFINLNDPDPYDDVTQCPVVISLMQRQKKRKCEHAIGFKIFKCDQTAKNLDEQYFRYHSSTDRTGTFINLREVSKRTLLPEGRYCIIPCTFKQGEEGNFLLRVFVEKKWGSSQGGRRHAVNDAMDSGATGSGIRNIPIQIEKTYGATDSNSIVDGVQNIDIKPGKSKSGGFLKPKRITGFALKQLEKNFPKGTKHLKEFYNWSKDRDSEFNLLQKISKSL